MMMNLPDDPTLDEIADALIPLVAQSAAFDGWGDKAILSAAQVAGVDSDLAKAAFPGGAVALIDRWFAWIDEEMARRLPPEALAEMKIRMRITRLVETRLEIVLPNKESLRRALTILAMPQNLARGTKLGWRAADAMWRLAGDTATDFNHYSKRGLLSGVYASSLAVFMGDDAPDMAATKAFLARRIDNVMQIEKAKAGFQKRSENRISLSRFFGRLRNPA
jgi:ubiquinone biosynthesis protein COQ9